MNYVNIKTSGVTQDGREIDLEAKEIPLNDVLSTVKALNQSIDSFQKDEKADDPKPNKKYSSLRYDCPHCKGTSCVKIISEMGKNKLYCYACQQIWGDLTPGKPKIPEIDKLITHVRKAFKVEREKMYDEETLLTTISMLSKIETRIIQALIYG